MKPVCLSLIAIVVLTAIAFWWDRTHPAVVATGGEIRIFSVEHQQIHVDNHADLLREARNLHDTRLKMFELDYGPAARLQLEAYESSVRAGDEDPCKGLSKKKCDGYEHNRQVLWSMKRSEWRQTDTQEEDRRKKSGLKDPVIWNGPEKFVRP